MIGKIQRVDLRKLWKYDALGFTKWLQNNTYVLNDILGLSPSSPEREKLLRQFIAKLKI